MRQMNRLMKNMPLSRFHRKRVFVVRITSLRDCVCLWWLRLWPGT